MFTPTEKAAIFQKLAQKTQVMPNGCHQWTGGRTAHGVGKSYGLTYFNKQRWLTHRLVMTAIFGSIAKGLEVDHICFNPLCLNPQHLQFLTHAQNCNRVNPNSDRNHCSEPWITPARDRFLVRVWSHGRVACTGTFRTLAEAIAFRDAWAAVLDVEVPSMEAVS